MGRYILGRFRICVGLYNNIFYKPKKAYKNIKILVGLATKLAQYKKKTHHLIVVQLVLVIFHVFWRKEGHRT